MVSPETFGGRPSLENWSAVPSSKQETKLYYDRGCSCSDVDAANLLNSQTWSQMVKTCGRKGGFSTFVEGVSGVSRHLKHQATIRAAASRKQTRKRPSNKGKSEKRKKEKEGEERVGAKTQY
jgi:hypothetical protein